MAHLVTGEAVILELRPATVASRGVSLFIDVAVQFAGFLLLALVLAGAVADVDDALGAAVGLSSTVCVLLGYPVAMETLTRGRTVGKLAMGLRVVRDDGGPIRFRHALMRGLLGIVEFWVLLGIPALLTSLVSSRSKRLGDMLAGTLVVRERMPHQEVPVIRVPQGLGGWAATLDLSRLPDGLALAARQYLSRAGHMFPETRDAMGRDLAEAVAAHVSPPPPPGLPPYPYLSAVLGERGRRESERLARLPARTPFAFDGGYAGSPPATPPYADRPGASPYADRPGASPYAAIPYAASSSDVAPPVPGGPAPAAPAATLPPMPGPVPSPAEPTPAPPTRPPEQRQSGDDGFAPPA